LFLFSFPPLSLRAPLGSVSCLGFCVVEFKTSLFFVTFNPFFFPFTYDRSDQPSHPRGFCVFSTPFFPVLVDDYLRLFFLAGCAGRFSLLHTSFVLLCCGRRVASFVSFPPSIFWPPHCPPFPLTCSCHRCLPLAVLFGLLRASTYMFLFLFFLLSVTRTPILHPFPLRMPNLCNALD